MSKGQPSRILATKLSNYFFLKIKNALKSIEKTAGFSTNFLSLPRKFSIQALNHLLLELSWLQRKEEQEGKYRSSSGKLPLTG